MGLDKKVYEYSDLKRQDLKSAPSLDIPSLKVEQYLLPKDGGKYMLFLASAATYPRECPYCHRSGYIQLSGYSKPRLIHDVVRGNHRVDIAYRPRRVMCTHPECNQRFTVDAEGILSSRQMTTRLFDFLRAECFLQPLTALAERCGVSIETVRNILLEESADFDKDREEHPLTAPRVLGIDEKHIVHQMRGVIVDIEKGDLLDMMEDNKEAAMKDAIRKLAGWETNIEVITTDMNNSYIRWLPDFLPNAKIVIDKFHVIQDIQQRITTTKSALYSYRKKLIESIEDPVEKAQQAKVLDILNKNKRLINYSLESLSRDEKNKAQKLYTIIDEFPEFKLLRKLYFLIEDMYEKDTREEAEAVWDEWVKLLPPSGERQYREWCDLYSVVPQLFDEFRSFTRNGFQFYKQYILNYFDPGCRYTNATTEGINNLIGSINISGNGYSFPALRAKCLYASLVHERIMYSFDVTSIPSWDSTLSMSFATGRSFGMHSTAPKVVFKQQVSKVNIPRPNIYSYNEQLIASIENVEPEDAVDVAEDSVVNSSWEVFQPDPAIRFTEAQEDDPE